MSIAPVYIPTRYNVFLYFLEGQVHKDSRLGIMTNMVKSRLAKVIFTMVFQRKLKPIHPSIPQHYNNCSAPTFLILFKNC